MIGNLGPTMVKGYDADGNSKWFEHGLPDGYKGSPPEIKEPGNSATDKEEEILELIEKLEDNQAPIAASDR